MPFSWADVGAYPGTEVKLTVEPGKVLQLKRELEEIYHEVVWFVENEAYGWSVRPPGTDPVSEDTATAFNDNVASAVHAARGYISELAKVIEALDQAAKRYRLAEDVNAASFPRVEP